MFFFRFICLFNSKAYFRKRYYTRPNAFVLLYKLNESRRKFPCLRANASPVNYKLPRFGVVNNGNNGAREM